jgi:hypothetical protein
MPVDSQTMRGAPFLLLTESPAIHPPRSGAATEIGVSFETINGAGTTEWVSFCRQLSERMLDRTWSLAGAKIKKRKNHQAAVRSTVRSATPSGAPVSPKG